MADKSVDSESRPFLENDALAFALCVTVVMMGFSISVMFFRGWIPTGVTYASWAVCSTALLAIGALQKQPRTLVGVPTVAGSVVAFAAAAYVLTVQIIDHPDVWAFMWWAIGMPSIGVWSYAMHDSVGRVCRPTASLLSRFLSVVYMLAVAAMPFGMLVLVQGRVDA